MRTDKTYYTESDIKKELGAGGTAGDGAAKEGTDAGAAYEKRAAAGAGTVRRAAAGAAG